MIGLYLQRNSKSCTKGRQRLVDRYIRPIEPETKMRISDDT